MSTSEVVMVAVPTVLGIASIRVYTVSEAPADGLVTREKLNIYSPLAQSAQVQFAPERPGVIEGGFTAAREAVVPLAQAVKSACVSAKRGSVNLYHAGQDVYYYLKDPPPGFLPRFGTITMAGLLGMFLARKGSRSKQLAVPLGLMSAGVSVCYPAQAVAVIKVTGRKVYAAGQWSSAAVSSLFTSTPQEPIAKEITGSQPQVSSPESAVAEASEVSSATGSSPQSATIPETEVESAESAPVSDEPMAAVITKEASSVTLTEISPDQAPTETHADPVVYSVPAKTETAPPPEELPAAVESEEPSDTKQAPEDVSNEASPAESVASLEPETVEAAPVQETAEVAEVQETLEAAPVAAPVQETVEVAPVQEVVEAAPVQAAQVESAPSSEEPAALKASEESAVPVVESAEPEPSALPESADQPPVAAVETPTPTLTPPPPAEQPAAENSKGGSDFKPDPSLMDFGQSNPEDEDLYSTRS
uniref:MICOS complex subunit n=1 Tax=Scophthalmus maximus TaxID=52904 RepID=A0A8D3AHN1_SCOMX